jgi:arylsulfatase A-like enzyme/tetratricopeptide (TPR) repeat protein
LITLDAVRADRLGCYGYSAANTPALDSLAAAGVRFSHAFAQSPLTLPSHATIFTGLYPAEHTLLDNGRRSLPKDITTLAEVFNQRGFATAAFVGGAFLDAFYGLEQGFQTYNDEFNNPVPIPEDRLVRPAQQVTDAALAWLQQSDKGPFFCWVNLADARIADDLSVPADALLGQRYDQQLALIDAQIARLIDFLERSHTLANTLVIVVAAQGEALADHAERRRGLFLYSSTLQVPLIFSSPGRLPAGRTVTAAVRLLDVFPTILDFQDWPVTVRPVSTQQQDLGIAAQSLLPALEGENFASRPCYARTDYPTHKFGWSSLSSLTTDSLHYVDAPTPEIYDLRLDPRQSSNLAASQPQRVAQMQALLTDLENSLAVRSPAQLKLSRQSLRILSSLPEMPDEYRSDFTIAPEDRPDPKDKMDVYRAYLAGSALLDRGEYDQALAYLTDAAAHSPASAYILSALAAVHQKQGQSKDSYERLRLALALQPNDPALLSQMVSLLTASGQVPQAINYCGLSLELKNLQPQIHTDLAVLLFSQKQIPIAIMALERALEIRPNYADAHFNLAVILTNTGRETQALGHFRSAAEALPDFTEAFFQWARLLATQRRYSEAAQKFQKVLDLDSERVDARYMLAKVFSRQNEFDQAIVHYRRALDDIAQPGAYQSLKAVLHQDLGAVLFKKGQVPEAVDQLERALRIKSDLAVAHYWLAQALASQKRNDQAIVHFQQALRLQSVFPEAAKPLGRLALDESRRLADARQFPQAIDLLTDVRKLIPRNLDVTNALARYFATCPDSRLRQGQVAVRLAKQTVAASGGLNPDFLDTLAAAYAEVGDFDKAVETATQAHYAAGAGGRRDLEMEIAVRVDLYRTNRPYREPAE